MYQLKIHTQRTTLYRNEANEVLDQLLWEGTLVNCIVIDQSQGLLPKHLEVQRDSEQSEDGQILSLVEICRKAINLLHHGEFIAVLTAPGTDSWTRTALGVAGFAIINNNSPDQENILIARKCFPQGVLHPNEYRQITAKHYVKPQWGLNGLASFLCEKEQDKKGKNQTTSTNIRQIKTNSFLKSLCFRLCPENGTVLDFMMGTGTTGCGAMQCSAGGKLESVSRSKRKIKPAVVWI